MTIFEVVEALCEAGIPYCLMSSDGGNSVTAMATLPGRYAEIQVFGDGSMGTRVYTAGPIVSGVNGLADVLVLGSDEKDAEPAADPYDGLRALKEQLVADQHFQAAATLRDLITKLTSKPV